jgi:protein-S-isoprenylcysteine O-methyltransferase Ste14
VDALDALLLISYAAQGVQILAFPVPSSASTLELLLRVGRHPAAPHGLPAAAARRSPLRMALLGLLTAAVVTTQFIPLLVLAAPPTRVWWGPFGDGRPAVLGALSAACLAGGNAISYAAVVSLRRAVCFHPWGEAAQLHTAGIYAAVRNPVTLGLGLLAAGYFFFFPSLGTLAGSVLFAVNAHIRIGMEERTLEQSFGEAYRRYRGCTHKYIPTLKRRRPACTP